MCKATSNSNISWSKKWNLHLTAFFNNVQSPFNRKMEQSANRKRKGLIKTHPSPELTMPPLRKHGTRWARRSGSSARTHSPHSTDKLRTGGEGPREVFSLGTGVVITSVHQLALLFAKENKATKAKPTRKSQEMSSEQCPAVTGLVLFYSKTLEFGHSSITQRVSHLIQEELAVPAVWLQWHLKPCHCSSALQARPSKSIQLTALTKTSAFTLRPRLTGWSLVVAIVVVVFIFIIYITDLLLMDSHLHMSESERNHLITCFPHQLRKRANNLLSTTFSSFFLCMWFTIPCQLQAGRIIF